MTWIAPGMLALALIACGGGSERSSADTSQGPEVTVGDTADTAGAADTAAPHSGSDTSSDTRDSPPDAADVVEADADTGFEAPPYPEPAVEGLISHVDDSFWANMDDFIFNVVLPSGVKLYVALNDANFYNRPERRALGLELFRNPESYFLNAVAPFVARYASTGAIWAVDCVNEPESIVAGAQGNYDSWGLSWPELADYVSRCAEIVHLYGDDVLVSVGSGWHDWAPLLAGYYNGLGLDFLDYHYYDDQPDPPPAETLGGGVPVLIGECGQASDDVDDELQYQAVKACFDRARERGYLGAMSWYYDHAASTNKHAHLNADGSWRKVGQVFDDYAQVEGFVTGLNLAWLGGAYDHDFGLNTLHPEWGIAYDHDQAAKVVSDYAAKGIDVMRLWLFEGQEALHFHSVFSDFERGHGGWEATPEGPVTLRDTDEFSGDGQRGLAIDIDASEPGWYGVSRRFTDDVLLNLDTASEWSYFARNGLGREVGVNLAFVVADGQGSTTTYQTRSDTDGGQLWLEREAARTHVVSLADEAFSATWALDTSPSVGVDRPPAEALARVVAVTVRVHLDGPTSGTLYLDRVRVR